MSNLPTSTRIKQWDDDHLKIVHRLIFDNNVNPGLPDDTQDDVDEYIYNVHAEYTSRFPVIPTQSDILANYSENIGYIPDAE